MTPADRERLLAELSPVVQVLRRRYWRVTDKPYRIPILRALVAYENCVAQYCDANGAVGSLCLAGGGVTTSTELSGQRNAVSATARKKS